MTTMAWEGQWAVGNRQSDFRLWAVVNRNDGPLPQYWGRGGGLHLPIGRADHRSYVYQMQGYL